MRSPWNDDTIVLMRNNMTASDGTMTSRNLTLAMFMMIVEGGWERDNITAEIDI